MQLTREQFEQIASLLTFINKTYSETGQVKLTSRDWRNSATMRPNCQVADDRSSGFWI